MTINGRTAVYRLYDSSGTLLYIGASNHPPTRYGEHSRSRLKPWWPEVARKDETWYDERTDAQEAEAEAVRTESPLHNSRLTANARTLTMAAKFSEAEAASIDAARGSVSRSEWLRTVALASIEPAQPTNLNDAAIEVNRNVTVNRDLETLGMVPASSLPKPRRCSHPGKRSVGGYCQECDHRIEPGGLWA